ncbi:hypothetical protein D3C81_601320 [compost metagenome]
MLDGCIFLDLKKSFNIYCLNAVSSKTRGSTFINKRIDEPISFKLSLVFFLQRSSNSAVLLYSLATSKRLLGAWRGEFTGPLLRISYPTTSPSKRETIGW